MSALVKGAQVRITCPWHRKDGHIGTIISGPGPFMGTYCVAIDGDDYGFLPQELTIIERVGDPTPSTESESTP